MNSKKFALMYTLIFNVFTPAFAETAQSFSETRFNKAISSKEAFVVAFHSDSCGSCKIQKPNLESLLQEEPLKDVLGLMANFEATSEFRKHLEKPVRGPSTILVFKQGQEVARVQGETDKQKIRDLISNAIKSN